MARKPQPGGDRNAWGLVMNEFLDTAHNPDGTIKPAGVQTAVATEVETALTVQLPPAVADAVAADSTVAAAAAAAIDAEPRVAANTAAIARVDPGEAAPKAGAVVAQGIMGPVWHQGPVSADWYSNLNDAVTVAGEGGIVSLSPDVEYVQDTPILALNNLTIQGDSRFGSVIKYTGDAAIQSPNSLTTRVEGLRMFNVTLDGHDVGGIGIDARSFTECHFDMVRIWNPVSHGIWWGGDGDYLGGWSNTFKRGLVRAPLNGDAMHLEGRAGGAEGAPTANHIHVEASIIYTRSSLNSCGVNIVNGEGNSFIGNDGGYGVNERSMFRLGSTLAARNRFISNRTENVTRAVLIEGGRDNMFALNSFGMYANTTYHGAEIYANSLRNAFLHNWWDSKGLNPRVWEDAGPGKYETIIDDLSPGFGDVMSNLVTDPRGRIHSVASTGAAALGVKVKGENRERLLILGTGALEWRNPADGSPATAMSVNPATKTVEWTNNTRFKVPTLDRPNASAEVENTICVSGGKLYICLNESGTYVWRQLATV